MHTFPHIRPRILSEFYPVYASIAADPDLSSSAKLLYGYLRYKSDKYGFAWPTVTDMAQAIGLAIRQIYNILEELIESGLIYREKIVINNSVASSITILLKHPLTPDQGIPSTKDDIRNLVREVVGDHKELELAYFDSQRRPSSGQLPPALNCMTPPALDCMTPPAVNCMTSNKDIEDKEKKSSKEHTQTPLFVCPDSSPEFFSPSQLYSAPNTPPLNPSPMAVCPDVGQLDDYIDGDILGAARLAYRRTRGAKWPNPSASKNVSSFERLVRLDAIEGRRPVMAGLLAFLNDDYARKRKFAIQIFIGLSTEWLLKGSEFFGVSSPSPAPRKRSEAKPAAKAGLSEIDLAIRLKNHWEAAKLPEIVSDTWTNKNLLEKIKDQKFLDHFDELVLKCSKLLAAKPDFDWLTFSWLVKGENWKQLLTDKYDFVFKKTSGPQRPRATPPWMIFYDLVTDGDWSRERYQTEFGFSYEEATERLKEKK